MTNPAERIKEIRKALELGYCATERDVAVEYTKFLLELIEEAKPHVAYSLGEFFNDDALCDSAKAEKRKAEQLLARMG